jgi:hypothetical protein
MSVLKCGGGTGGLSVDDFAFIRQWATRPTSRLKQIPSVWRRFGALRPTIETALSSQCGKDILAAEYVNELKALAEPADEQWRILVAANPKMSAAEKFFKLYALDFANVVGAPDGFIGQVRNSNNVVCFALCKAGIVPSYHVSSPPTVVDLIRYQFEATCYGYVPEPTRQYDALRRLNRVLGEASVPSGILAENDKTYLAGRFADIVAMASSATSSDDLQNISELVSAADPPRDNAEHARPLSPDQLAAARAACQRS